MIGTLATLAVVVLAAPKTDTTFTVKQGTRLELNQFAGSIEVKTWTKNAVRVVADHGSRTEIEIESNSPSTLEIQANHWRGIPTTVDFQLTVPKWMALNLSGVNTEVSVEDSGGEIHIETVSGEVSVTGGTKIVEASSVEGEVRIANATGRIEVSSVNGTVTVERSSGPVLASSVNGEIVMRTLESDDVEASTVNGSVSYEGSIRNEGSYRLSTHNGEIEVAVPERANATVSVATFSGEFYSEFPIELSETRRKRFNFTLGTGGARMELESFQGTIRLRRPGNLGGKSSVEFRYDAKTKQPVKTKDKDKNKHSGGDHEP